MPRPDATHNSHMTDSPEQRYWVITGRICGDWEDAIYTFGPCSEVEAIQNFRAAIRYDSGLPELGGQPDPEGIDPDGIAVFITHVLSSSTPIS